MRKFAVEYYKNGYNCSQCILKAAAEKFNFTLPKQCLNMCAAVNNGFGIKSTCSVLIAGIMTLGIIFNEQTAKRLRIKFLNEFNSKCGNLNCAHLKIENDREYKCERIIGTAADILEKIILDERRG